MSKSIQLSIVLILVLVSCTPRQSLSDQLKANFSSHLNKVDSSLVLDSFAVLRTDTVTKKFGVIIEDTIYKFLFARVQSQLNNALLGNNKDSIEFYQYEINYMKTQIDSLTNSIKTADTTRKFGLMAACMFQIRKNDTHRKGEVYYFLDKRMKILNSAMVDSIIGRSYRLMK